MELIAEQDILLSNLKEIYYMKANECEKQWVRDNAAALKIQSKFRMYIKRKEFLRKKTAAIKISTHFRAYYARKLYKQKR
jgi:myosin-5